jgi:CubicO group peptidase (beta-lactamase class C family)
MTTSLRGADRRELTRLIGRVRKHFDVPGLAVAMVEAGQAVLARGYGVRGIDDPRPIDGETIFPIASNTKAFTAAVLATLVDEGALGWDDPVVNHLPSFQMWDPWVTREITVRDLLVHRSGLGLGAGDLMWFPKTDFTAAQLVAGLRWLKPKTSFRSTYAYDNVLYEVAAQLIAAVSGRSWSDLVGERILRPAGMAHAVLGESAFFAASNRASPHGKISGDERGAGPLSILATTNVGDLFVAAGGISASAADLTRWLLAQLGKGAIPGGPRLFSAEQSREMWTPQTLIPPTLRLGAAGWPAPSFRAYALGWEVALIDGETIIRHGGYVHGFMSYTVLVPRLSTGFVILTNAEQGYAISAIALTLLDRCFGRPPADQLACVIAEREKDVAEARRAAPELARDPLATPALPLAAYAGVYRDPWYGTITITEARGALTIRFDRTPGMEGALEPWLHETFRTRWRLREIEDAYVTFALTAEGAIRDVTLRAVSPLADFSFDYQDLLFTPGP